MVVLSAQDDRQRRFIVVPGFTGILVGLLIRLLHSKHNIKGLKMTEPRFSLTGSPGRSTPGLEEQQLPRSRQVSGFFSPVAPQADGQM